MTRRKSVGASRTGVLPLRCGGSLDVSDSRVSLHCPFPSRPPSQKTPDLVGGKEDGTTHRLSGVGSTLVVRFGRRTGGVAGLSRRLKSGPLVVTPSPVCLLHQRHSVAPLVSPGVTLTGVPRLVPCRGGGGRLTGSGPGTVLVSRLRPRPRRVRTGPRVEENRYRASLVTRLKSEPFGGPGPRTLPRPV